ncbi:unnamed protein product [marine sediment metagenome]|uniref:Uncharacterized protein n=1 Tax=marine sediment metagenome TaxID=412755 RepID=X1P0W0_9ZZZZ
MNRRINTRVIDTGGVASPVPPVAAQPPIEKEASEIYWMTVSPQALATQGWLNIYDGYDTWGKLVWRVEPGYARQHNFIPPIQCEQGIYAGWDAHIGSFTIAWRPKKWDRPKPMKTDVIEHPEA